jgi:hypothetical protein
MSEIAWIWYDKRYHWMMSLGGYPWAEDISPEEVVEVVYDPGVTRHSKIMLKAYKKLQERGIELDGEILNQIRRLRMLPPISDA